MLPDSTVLEQWTLANGLNVVTRHVPQAGAVAVSVAYRGGSRLDPDGREGLAALLAEVAYTGMAGDVPERTRAEMSGLRPKGWNLRVSTDYVLFAEMAAVNQFPGVLHQVAQRMRGVSVTDALLRSARTTVRRDLEEKYARNVDLALPNQVRVLATGGSEATLTRHATGAGIEKLNAGEAQKLVRTRFVPMNAVMSITGNLSGVDIRRLVESEFAAIPAGTRLKESPPAAPKAGVYTLSSSAIQGPVGALGIIAPALSDSLHPSFYLHMLELGSLTRQVWSPPPAPMSTTFEYSMIDNPDLAIFYPPVFGESGSGSLTEGLQITMADLPLDRIDQGTVDQVTGAIGWLLGGPLSADLLRRMRSESAPLYTLSSSTAVRELRGGEAFWSQYRTRFAAAQLPGLEYWIPYFGNPSNQVQVKLTPAR
jgi:hypothetical protein